MATGLELDYGYKTRPSALLNSIFMTTVNMAARSLVSMAKNAKSEHGEKWKPAQHLRFMVMLMTWFTVWVLRVLMDHFPSSLGPSSLYQLQGFSPVGLLDWPSLLSSSSTPSLDLIMQEGLDGPSVEALGRALSHILTLMNEIPATSRKYQFAMSMADKIMDENARCRHVELLHINRTVLSSAFARTSSLLYRSLQQDQTEEEEFTRGAGAWTSRVVGALPLGSYLVPYINGLNTCIRGVSQLVKSETWQPRRRARGGNQTGEEVVAEKHAQELLWITNKLRAYGAGDEAVVQWSFASGIASLALYANPRVQGYIVKISATLFAVLTRENFEASRQVKFGLLVLWIPLFCHMSNGLAFPILTNFEKAELERAMDQVIQTLPPTDQEVILCNWFQDFAVSASDWPNLQLSYDRWCHSTRQLVI